MTSRDEVLPDARREGTGLCLSGGGYRAALFHLGGLRRLNELGLLSQVSTVSSVSGGSIVAAFAAARLDWSAATAGSPLADFDEALATPLRDLCRRNIRLRPAAWELVTTLLSLPSQLPVVKRAARRLPSVPVLCDLAARSFERVYRRHVTGISLQELPRSPRFVFCATDMAFGVNWVFDSRETRRGVGRVGDWQAGYASPFPDWPVARAVACSACFPPVFSPRLVGLPPSAYDGGSYWRELGDAHRSRLLSSIKLSDGGVYDNLALEPVWKDHAVVLVSDGGATFDPAADTGFPSRISRFPAIVERGSRATRKRWLLASFSQEVMTGCYWGVGSASERYGIDNGGYDKAIVRRHIAEVRTDLDRFTSEEMGILENHGYLVADAACRAHLAGRLPASPPAATAPHPGLLDADAVARHLAKSNVRTLLGRGALAPGRRPPRSE